MAIATHDYTFQNDPAPQVVAAGVASAAIGWTHIRVCATDDCFILVSAAGTIPTGGTDGHCLFGGTTISLVGLNPAHKIACSAGTLYISAFS